MTPGSPFDILFGVDAIPVGSGGIDGAEGCKVFLLEGSDESAEAAYDAVVKIRGEPELKTNIMKKPEHLA